MGSDGSARDGERRLLPEESRCFGRFTGRTKMQNAFKKKKGGQVIEMTHYNIMERSGILHKQAVVKDGPVTGSSCTHLPLASRKACSPLRRNCQILGAPEILYKLIQVCVSPVITRWVSLEELRQRRSGVNLN